MKKLLFLLVVFVSLCAFKGETVRLNESNEFGDEVYFPTEEERLALIKVGNSICSCHPSPHTANTLLGSCCWEPVTGAYPVCYNAAGTGRSCI